MEHNLPPPDGDRDRRPAIIVPLAILTSFCIVIVGLRFFARSLTGKFGWDDWTMLGSLVKPHRLV